MSHFVKIFSPIFLIFFLSACTISHEYGPYMGKVVDKESGDPIEGAVVFLRFFTETIGPNTEYADAVEALTDNNGEFEIPPYRITMFRILHYWEDHCSAIIFKPGYGAFPRHRGTEISPSQDGFFPENQYVTIKLPKLKTREERKENLFNIPNLDAPSDKYIKLRELEKIERIEAGINR